MLIPARNLVHFITLPDYIRLSLVDQTINLLSPLNTTKINLVTLRDPASINMLKEKLGFQTLEYQDPLIQMDAKHRQSQLMQDVMFGGGDPVKAALEMSHFAERSQTPTRQRRDLRTFDEIARTPNDKQFIFIDGIPHPIYADRAPYYEQRSMAGRYHPNPYHPPSGKVKVKTRLGYSWRRVIREHVPKKYAHLPQYADGYWSYIQGFRPR